MIMEQNIFNTVYKVNHAGGSGSCFYLKNYDLFVTNYHVVDGFREVALQDNDKNRFYARVVLVNPAKDIAFLKAEGDFSALPEIALSALDSVSIGEALNSGAHLTALERTRVGDVRIEDCLNPLDFKEWIDGQDLVISDEL